MMWAESQGHTIANERLVATKLEAADKAILAQDLSFGKAVSAMKGELQKNGAEVLGGYYGLRELEAEIFTATEKALMDLKKAHCDEQFYACVLYTDSSAMTIAFSTNSEEALKAKLDLEDPLERDELESYYKWTSSEWEYEAWGGEYFKNPCRLIRESGERIDISGFKKKFLP